MKSEEGIATAESTRKYSPPRFWAEVVVSIIALGATLLTLLTPQWIERVFGIDPDRGSGTLEWIIVGVLVAIAVVMLALAWGERRVLRTAS